MYWCESWTIRKAECQRIDGFELWSWRRLLRVPWTARRSNHSILKEINPEYSLEGLMLKLKLQYFGHLMQRANLLEEKTLRLGKIEGKRRSGQQRMWWWGSITDLVDMNLIKTGDSGRQGSLACCSPWGHRVRLNLATEQHQISLQFYLSFCSVLELILWLIILANIFFLIHEILDVNF